ncbi:MAG: RNA polymerase sigma factor [Candidatus Doudnabacteria bacterium]|nr:RNA polymerase sigma factor [Candidatus Doudnabacteria bacterium]
MEREKNSMEQQELSAIASCQQGQLHAFSILYDAYVKRIYNFIYYRTHHKETAEDLTSLTFTKALTNIQSFDPSVGAFSSWIHRIARNSVIDHYRTNKSTKDIFDAFDLASNSNVERDVDTAMKLEKVNGYLALLPKEQRELVIMRVWDSLSYREIGEIMGKSEASCKVSFSRIMHKLQAEAIFALIMLIISKPLI